MKKLLLLVAVVIGGLLLWQYLMQPPDPSEVRRKAQQTDHQTVRYWLEAAKEKRVYEAIAVCNEVAKGQTNSVFEALRRKEAQVGGTFNKYDFYSMGAPGAYKAVLGSDAGALMQMTIRAQKTGDTYWIVEVTADF